MSRTYRNKRPKFRFGTMKGLLKNKKVMDGTVQYFAHSCKPNGGCPYCYHNRFHSTFKRNMLKEELEMINSKNINIPDNIEDVKDELQEYPTYEQLLERVKALPDVFMLAELVQFKYVQSIGKPNNVNFVVEMAGGHKINGKPEEYIPIFFKYIKWLETRNQSLLLS